MLTGQKWEEVKKGGDTAIKKWINDEMSGKTCLVVLVGTNTSTRPWVQYEIIKAWNDKLGVVGSPHSRFEGFDHAVDFHERNSPFDGVNVNGNPMGSIVTLYDPPGADSKAVYASINDNMEKLVEDAIKIRNKY